MKTSHMTTERCIEDLKTLKAYFIQKSIFGAYPECIDYAIEQLEKSIQKTQKALSMREDNRRRPHE